MIGPGRDESKVLGTLMYVSPIVRTPDNSSKNNFMTGTLDNESEGR